MADPILTKLQPCPFCGGAGRLETREHLAGAANTYFIRCAICEAQTMAYYGRPAWAVEAWNTRTTPKTT